MCPLIHENQPIMIFYITDLVFLPILKITTIIEQTRTLGEGGVEGGRVLCQYQSNYKVETLVENKVIK